MYEFHKLKHMEVGVWLWWVTQKFIIHNCPPDLKTTSHWSVPLFLGQHFLNVHINTSTWSKQCLCVTCCSCVHMLWSWACLWAWLWVRLYAHVQILQLTWVCHTDSAVFSYYSVWMRHLPILCKALVSCTISRLLVAACMVQLMLWSIVADALISMQQSVYTSFQLFSIGQRIRWRICRQWVVNTNNRFYYLVKLGQCCTFNGNENFMNN